MCIARWGSVATFILIAAPVCEGAETPSWQPTTAGCKWWGILGAGYSDIAWSGQCEDSLVHGEGRFSWRHANGQSGTNDPTVFYHGLQIGVEALRDSYYLDKLRQCYDLHSNLKTTVAPVIPNVDPADMSRVSPFRTDGTGTVMNTRLISSAEVGSYRFNIFNGFASYRWCCSRGSAIGLCDGYYIVAKADSEISQADSLDNLFIAEVFNASEQIAISDVERRRSDKSMLRNAKAPTHKMILIDTVGSDARLIASMRYKDIENFAKLEHDRLLARQKQEMAEIARAEEQKRQEIARAEAIRKQELARADAEAAQARAKAESKRQFDEFADQHGVMTWPKHAALFSNPFQFEGQIVGVRASFGHMIDRASALFIGSGGEILSVKGFPITRFSGGEAIVLAARVTGIAEVDVALGKQRAVDLEFIAMHVCGDRNCGELLSWYQ